MKSYLDINGYHITKLTLTDEQIEVIKSELNVKPIDGFAQETKPYKIYKETDDEFIIPRYYGTKTFGQPNKTKFKNKNININFITHLRDYQEPIVKKCIEQIKTNGGGLLSVPCGRGKTVMAIKIACELKLKTLVIVHKSFLQDQWIARIKQFTDCKVGIIRQNTVEIEDCQFVVAMIQSISKRDYGDIFREFGFTICDECHHFSSKYFAQALTKTCTKYTLGLSATPYRNDGLIRIVNWYLGEMAYKEKLKSNNQVATKILSFYSTDKLFKEKTRKFQGQIRPDCTAMVNNLVELEDRNNHLVSIINELRKDPDRKILILSGRKNHLKLLKKNVDELIEQDIKDNKILKDECKTCFYTGDTKQNERFEVEKYGDVLFATYDMAHEGLDIERLNTVVLATPQKDVVQAIGRILRKVLQDGDIRPLIIDFIDDIPVFVSQGNKREHLYNQNKYIMNYYYLYNNNIVSPKQYLNEQNKNSNNMCDTKPLGYDKILEVSQVELIEENNEVNIEKNTNIERDMIFDLC